MNTQRLSSATRPVLRGLLVLFLLILLSGCDTGGSNETVVLNDPINPTETSFEFRYSEDQLNGDEIVVTSEELDQLTEVLDAYGFSRSDVVSARVEEVRMVRRTSSSSLAAKREAKVFGYLSRVEVYFGPSQDGPLIGHLDSVPASLEGIALNAGPDRDVTSIVKGGATRALLRLVISDPNQIGAGGDGIDVDIRFRIEVQQ